jgi:hypothetical protein
VLGCRFRDCPGLSDQGRDRRLSGGLCPGVRAPCPNRGQGRPTGEDRVDHLVTPIMWLVATRLTVKTALGRKLRDHFLDPPRGIPLGRVRRKDFAPAGIKRVPRMTGAKNGYPLLEDGTVLNVSADPQRPSHSRSGHRRVGSRSLFHGASLPLLAELGAGGRRGPGCREHRQPHRFHTAGRKSRALWPAREPPGGNMQSWFAPLLLTICIANRALQLFALSQRPTSWSPPIRAEPM